MYSYALYGHQFLSPISLSLPNSSRQGLNIFTITIGDANPDFSDAAVIQCEPVKGYARIHWKQFEFFCFTNRSIRISPSVAKSQEGLQLLTKSIVPIALMVCSEIVLHASAFAYGKDGYLILGKSGTGKSTLASYAASQNSAHLGDDSVLLTEIAGKYHLAPSGTGLYLKDDAFKFLSLSEGDEEIYSTKGKRFVSPENIKNSGTTFLKLKKIIYLFHEKDRGIFEDLPGRLKLLIDSVYMSEVMLSFTAGRYLEALKHLAGEVPVEFTEVKRPETAQLPLQFQPTKEIYERIIA